MKSMTYAPAAPGPAAMRRRDWQKEQTRLDLALAAFELAKAEGLANVRVPQIAEAVGCRPGRSTTTSRAKRQRSSGRPPCEAPAWPLISPSAPLGSHSPTHWS